jgi:hypothetical protein
VGNEEQCRFTFDGEVHEGKALLETEELIIRGDRRFRFRFSELTSVAANGGTLSFQHQGKRVELQLGAQAIKWQQKIANPKPVAEKLGLKDGMRVGLDGIEQSELETSSKISFVPGTKAAAASLDAYFLRLRSKSDLKRIDAARKRLSPSGALWTLRAKGTAEISESIVREAGLAAGLVDVKVVRFSASETAEKFVLPKSKR